MDFLTRISIRSLRSAQKNRSFLRFFRHEWTWEESTISRGHAQHLWIVGVVHCNKPSVVWIVDSTEVIGQVKDMTPSSSTLVMEVGNPTKKRGSGELPVTPLKEKTASGVFPREKGSRVSPIGSRIVFLTHHGFQGRAVKLQGCTRNFWISFSFLSRSPKKHKRNKETYQPFAA